MLCNFRFHKLVRKLNDTVPTSAISYFWHRFDFTSVFAGQPRKSKKRKVFFQHYQENNIILENFQTDLLTIPTRFTTDDSDKYVLGCVDTVSKYFIFAFIKNKLCNTIIQGFADILRQIRKLHNDYNVTTEHFNITFVADRGEEFKFPKLKSFLMDKYNAVIHNIGIPSKSKVGGIERTFR